VVLTPVACVGKSFGASGVKINKNKIGGGFDRL